MWYSSRQREPRHQQKLSIMTAFWFNWQWLIEFIWTELLPASAYVAVSGKAKWQTNIEVQRISMTSVRKAYALPFKRAENRRANNIAIKAKTISASKFSIESPSFEAKIRLEWKQTLKHLLEKHSTPCYQHTAFLLLPHLPQCLFIEFCMPPACFF